ncbi:MAG: RloB domain-containing protein [Acetobacter sp.]|nr:RloB domain-containing protein [Acetobacter sp.]
MTQKPPRGKRLNQHRNPAIPMIISTEGETEEEYFKACKEVCKKEYSLIIINKKNRSSPLQIVQALEEKKTTLDDCMKHVAVFFAVFDHKKDPNTGKDVYNEAIKLCKKNKFTPITSKPSFEFWLLLHFTYMDREMTPEKAEEELKKIYKSKLNKDYEKGSSNTFKNTKSLLGDAIKHAEETWKKERERACSKEKSRQKEKSSYTNVHELIQKLNL